MPEQVTESGWHKQLDQLETERWYSPVGVPSPSPSGSGESGKESASRPLRIVRVTGGFRGFDGPCLRPPIVSANEAGLFVADGHETWQLLADAFGTLWHPVPGSAPQSSSPAAGSRVAIDSQGKVTWHGTHRFVELAEASSFACDGQTLAVTLPTSYHVFLVALAT